MTSQLRTASVEEGEWGQGGLNGVQVSMIIVAKALKRDRK